MLDTQTAEGGFEQFEGVKNAHWAGMLARGLGDPGVAPGVTCDDQIDLRVLDVGPLAV